MKAVPLPAPSFGFDTVQPTASAVSGVAPVNLGCFALRYLGELADDETRALTTAGIGVMGVTYAGRTDGLQSVIQARAALLAPGTTLWIDVESVGDKDAASIVRDVNAWGEHVKDGGYQAGMYVGVNCKLTSSELSALVVTRYWKSCSRCVDREGQVQEPTRGFCLYQLRPPNVSRGGLVVDVDFCQVDYAGDVPMMTVA